jgi:L-lactate dehydrogenase complex protein LldG
MAGEEREGQMSARDEIFASIRRSLGVTGNEAPRRAAVEARLAAAPSGIIPRRGQGDAAERLATFKAEAARAQASVAEAATLADLPAEVARFLGDNHLPASLRVGADARLLVLPWEAAGLELSRGPSDGDDANAASIAFAGVAESGTLALVSGADNPTTLDFLPETQIVALFVADLVGDYESVFAKLRATCPSPRAVHFITGPSRSADIEETLLIGADGPRRLHVVVVAAP